MCHVTETGNEANKFPHTLLVILWFEHLRYVLTIRLADRDKREIKGHAPVRRTILFLPYIQGLIFSLLATAKCID